MPRAGGGAGPGHWASTTAVLKLGKWAIIGIGNTRLCLPAGFAKDSMIICNSSRETHNHRENTSQVEASVHPFAMKVTICQASQPRVLHGMDASMNSQTAASITSASRRA